MVNHIGSPDNNFSKNNMSRPRILFYVERNLHLPFLEPIHDYLAVNSQYKLAFSSPPYMPPMKNAPGCGLESEVIRRLRKKSLFYGVPEEFAPDITVVADSCFYLVRNCGKIINVGHGLISKGIFYKNAPIVRRDNLADVICVPGPWHKSILEKNVFVPIQVSGFLKNDSIYHFGEMKRKDFLEKYSIDEGNNIILYAPTFNEELSSIPCIQDKIAELTDNKSVVLIKLHGMTASNYIEIYRKLSKINNKIKFINDEDFTGAMVCADVMISDVSSAYVEFMLLDKPIVLFNNPLMKRYEKYDSSDIEHQVRDALIEVNTMEELKLAVKLSIADPEEYGNKRRLYAKALSERIDGNAAKRVAETIDGLLKGEIIKKPDPSNIYSVIYQTDRVLSRIEMNNVVESIANKNGGVNFEVIIVGPDHEQNNVHLTNVSGYVTANNITFRSILEAVNKSKGQFVILLNQNRILPDNWIDLMHHYFIYHPDAVAVKSLSSNENFHSILNRFDYDDDSLNFSGVSEFFFYCLVGNDLKCDYFDSDCLMLKRDIFNLDTHIELYSDLSTGLQKFKDLINNNGYTSWYAPEIFNYQGSVNPDNELNIYLDNDQEVSPVQDETKEENNETIAEILESARKYKKNKDFENAITELNRAKEFFESFMQVDDYSDFQGRIIEKLTAAKVSKKDKDFQNAIGLLEDAKLIIAVNKAQNNSNSSEVIDLLEKSKIYKQNKEYSQSIELLEQAKLIIA